MLTICFLFKPVLGVTIKTVLKLCVCILPRRYWSQSWLPFVVRLHQRYSLALLHSSIGPVARKHTHEHLLSPPEIKDLALIATW